MRNLSNEFNIKALEIRNQNEKVIARYLHESLRLSHPRIKKMDEALDQISRAKEIVPNYFEIYRISALIKSYRGDLLGANEDYLIALEIEPNNARLLYFYSMFMLTKMNDVESALTYAKKAYEIKPESLEIAICYARCMGYQGNFDVAIDILDKRFNDDTQMPPDTFRVITTIMIDLYRRWANTDVDLNCDRKSAMIKLLKTTELFERAAKFGEIDFPMIREFSEALYWLLITIADSGEEQDREFVINLYRKYEDYIEQSPSFPRIRETIIQQYDTSLFELDPKKYTGTVIKFKLERPFAFIEDSINGELYFHKNSMLNTRDWFKIKNGTKVKYSRGTNAKGPCAIKIMILDNV